jgi:hypothetical protein
MKAFDVVESVLSTHFLVIGGLLVSECSTTTQVLFGHSFVKPLLASFDQPRVSSDAGGVLLRLLDDRLGVTAALAAALPDTRDPGRVQHAQLDLVRQRVYAIACGYEDGNDALRLRHDPTQLLLLGRDPLSGPPLGSQPTISRFENRHALRSLIAGAEAVMDAVIASHRGRLGKRVKRITIDLDGTVDPAYGNQQGVLFNGYFDEHCLYPLLASVQFDREPDQHLIAALWRPGTAAASLGFGAILRRLLPRLRSAFPRARIRFRGDGGFATPKVYDYLERQELEYVIGLPDNRALAKLAEPFMQRARDASAATGASARRYAAVTYKAKSWPHPRRVIIKAEVTRYPGRAPRDNPRYVVTNLRGRPEAVYARIYAPRGDMENRIKEAKEALRIDRLSCSSMLANQLRLLLTLCAFALYQLLRLHAARTELARAHIGTLRERLIKLAGVIEVSRRRITLRLPQHAPSQLAWARIAYALQANAP